LDSFRRKKLNFAAWLIIPWAVNTVFPADHDTNAVSCCENQADS